MVFFLLLFFIETEHFFIGWYWNETSPSKSMVIRLWKWPTAFETFNEVMSNDLICAPLKTRCCQGVEPRNGFCEPHRLRTPQHTPWLVSGYEPSCVAKVNSPILIIFFPVHPIKKKMQWNSFSSSDSSEENDFIFEVGRIKVNMLVKWFQERKRLTRQSPILYRVDANETLVHHYFSPNPLYDKHHFN